VGRGRGSGGVSPQVGGGGAHARGACRRSLIGRGQWGWGTNYIHIKSTTVYVPSLELRLSHPPLSPASVPLPPEPKVGGHTRVWVRGWGSPNSNDWRKSLALCLICGVGRTRGANSQSGAEIFTIFRENKEKLLGFIYVVFSI
jgi:hypothetical protein